MTRLFGRWGERRTFWVDWFSRLLRGGFRLKKLSAYFYIPREEYFGYGLALGVKSRLSHVNNGHLTKSRRALKKGNEVSRTLKRSLVLTTN